MQDRPQCRGQQVQFKQPTHRNAGTDTQESQHRNHQSSSTAQEDITYSSTRLAAVLTRNQKEAVRERTAVQEQK